MLALAVSVVALAVALFAVASGGNAPAAQQKDSFGRIVAEGKITACYVPWPPSVIKDPNTGKVSGFIIDIFDKIASDANLNVTYVESTWGGFPADLNTGKCDVAAAGVYPLISRSTAVAFTRPYLYSGYSAVARSGDSRFKTADDFNKKGVKIAVVQGEYGHIYAQKYFPNAELLVLDKSSDLSLPIVSVSSGQADVGFSTSDVVGEYAKMHPEVQNLYPDRPFATVPTTLAARQGDSKLMGFLDNGLGYLGSTGFIEGAVKSYNASYWYKQDTQYKEIK